MNQSKSLAYKFGGTERDDLAQELDILAWRNPHLKDGRLYNRMRWYAIDYYRQAKKRRDRKVQPNQKLRRYRK